MDAPLVLGVDYTVSYINNTTINYGYGTKMPTAKVVGKGNYKGFVSEEQHSDILEQI